jgi:cold shock CspA family protein
MATCEAISKLVSEKSGLLLQRRRPVVEEDGYNRPPSNSDVPLRPAEPSVLPVRGQVKWFNPNKGYGFVQLSDGSNDAFLHATALGGIGLSAVQPGETLEMRVASGQRGPQVAERFEDKRLTGPNDVVVKSDNSIWFSDNGAGTRGNYLGHTAPRELPFRVYRLDPATKQMTIAVDDMKRPNGLAFSPDEKLLYVVDAPGPMQRTVQVYDVVDNGTRTANRREIFNAESGGTEGSASMSTAICGAGFSAARPRTGWPSSPPTAR